MSIVSISLNDKMLCDLDAMQEELGYTGRSEIIRDALRHFFGEQKEQRKLKGTKDAVLMIAHNDQHSEDVSKIRHDFEKLIKTQLHNHLENHQCLEVFILHGDAKDIVKLTDAFQTNKKIDYVKLFVA